MKTLIAICLMVFALAVSLAMGVPLLWIILLVTEQYPRGSTEAQLISFFLACSLPAVLGGYLVCVCRLSRNQPLTIERRRLDG